MAYLGSSALQTSTANQEIVPNPPVSWRGVSYSFKGFSFINKQACTVKINGSNPIFLDVQQGFEASREPIKSFIIVEAGIEYQWVGQY